MKQKLIAQGAEAKIWQDKHKITKERLKKSYRLPALDEKLRKQRTKRELGLLEKASHLINTPKIISASKFNIEMEFISGDKLSKKLNSYPEKKQLIVMKQLGTEVSKLHENNIIHGDLTTSNTILKENKLYIIDFGLGFISQREEDKAVDLHLIKQALEAKHYQNHNKLFASFLEGYNNKQVVERLKKVEARGRNKH